MIEFREKNNLGFTFEENISITSIYSYYITVYYNSTFYNYIKEHRNVKFKYFEKSLKKNETSKSSLIKEPR